MHPLLSRLEEGDFKSLGQVPDVVSEVLSDNSLLSILVEGVTNENPKIAYRSTVALDKIGRQSLNLLNQEKEKIIQIAIKTNDKNIMWHLSIVLSYLNLIDDEIGTVLNQIIAWLNNINLSIFGKVNCMQAIATISKSKKELIPEAIAIIENEMSKGKAAINARGRILLKELKRF